MKIYQIIPKMIEHGNNYAITQSESGDCVLYSYGCRIIARVGGKLVRLYDKPLSLTTCKHLKIFCNLCWDEVLTKKDFESLPYQGGE